MKNRFFLIVFLFAIANINAAYSQVYHTINAEISISLKCATMEPMGEIKVLEHTDQTFFIDSHCNSNISGAIVDGVFIPNEGDPHYMVYTFKDVTEDHTIQVYIDGGGITEENEISNNLFSIYPNPANNYVEIILSDAALAKSTVTAQIYNTQGALLKNLQLYSRKTQIDISNLSKGLYLVKIANDTKKLIVK
ncbi:MAG: T9SS type A sorting domain-containing protein [Bacteroidetes bacterium]|nr:T9SS type A sorting domain-containing protein [Bacteroidota bacterium]MCL1969319.1 T9SS type A sorting domain-containing protein [Bacteroidota bacterium]